MGREIGAEKETGVLSVGVRLELVGASATAHAAADTILMAWAGLYASEVFHRRTYPVHAWMYDSPFYQDFAEVDRVEVETVALEAQGTPDDAGGITDFEEPYVNAVRSSSDRSGGITDFEEPYVNAVRATHNTVLTTPHMVVEEVYPELEM